MSKKDSVLPVAHIAALTQLVRFAPDAFEQKSEIIMTYLSKRILMVPIPPVSTQVHLCVDQALLI
jgi:sister chromatid cohesion protein PDS5